MRLFLHMPKCAGTSIRSILEALAPNDLVIDYQSYFSSPRPERSEKILRALLEPLDLGPEKFVYGHFFPVKYLGVQAAHASTLVTIIREPIDRLISHYYYWNAGDFSAHWIWRKMKEEEWSLERFILSDEMRNFYSQYLAHTSLGQFAYIGVYENLTESVHRCLRELGLAMNSSELPHLNARTSPRTSGIGAHFLEQARAFHSEDYIIYRYALERWHSHIRRE